jgi:hypothetical protein
MQRIAAPTLKGSHKSAATSLVQPGYGVHPLPSAAFKSRRALAWMMAR